MLKRRGPMMKPRVMNELEKAHKLKQTLRRLFIALRSYKT